MARDVTLHISKRMAFKALRPDKSSKGWCRKKREVCPGEKEELIKLRKKPPEYL